MHIQNYLVLTHLICILTMLFILPLNAIAKQLPDLGNSNRNILSIQEEKLIGESWLQKLRAANLVCEDPIINSYLNYLGHQILAHADIKHFNFKFFAIEDYAINAFAFFGGNIGIHKGLILATQNEQELAGAIAHEIAHITQEHLLRGIVKNRQSMPITLAGTLASVLLGAPDLAIPILATQQQRVINYTREHEQEADNVGMQLLADAGFDPEGMIALFKRMDQHEQYNTGMPEYLRTHPIFDTRISEAQHRASRFQYRQRSSSFNYYLIKAKIESTANINQQETIANLEEQLNKKRYDNKAATLYGYALALAANYNHDQAYKILEPLVKQHPNNLIIQLSMTELQIVKQNTLQAIAKMQALLSIFPGEPALIIKYAETLIAAKKIAAARTALLALMKTRIFEPIIYKLLAQAEGMSENKAGMHQATAEWYVCYGDMDNAIMQLDFALKFAQDNVQLKAVIEKRKAELEELKNKSS